MLITLGVVAARGATKRTRQSESMNAMLTHITKPRSWRSYARTSLTIKFWALGSLTRRSE